MNNQECRNVRDFKKGLKVFFLTILIVAPIFILPFVIGLASLLDSVGIDRTNLNENFIDYCLLFFLFLVLLLATKGFIVNVTPLKIQNGKVYIPARDQIRGIMDILTINPITGFFRRREYGVNEIENVANGYTRPGRGSKNRSWNVVITGMKNGNSFSQRIDVSNKQVRDEVRNALKHSISGRVNSEFSY